MFDKMKLRDTIVVHLEEQARQQEADSAKATEFALSYPGGGKSHSDTQMFQHQERAELIAISARELRASVADVLAMDISIVHQKVEVGAIVRVRDQDGSESTLVIIPGKHGCHLELDGKEIFAVNQVTPVGSALIGHRAGERVVVRLGAGRDRPLDILEVE